MVDKSQENAFELLKEAKEKGALDSSIEEKLAKLIGVEERSKVKEVLETPVSAEAEKREITPEQVDELVSALRTRFERPANKELRQIIEWVDIEKSLRAAPVEVLYLEETGGEPQIVGIEGDEIIIEDRSKKTPTGRRNLTFDEADAQRVSFGQNVRFQSLNSYRTMKKKGKYDINTWSWLATDDITRESRFAMAGYYDGGVRVEPTFADTRRPNRGWRAEVRIKKVL